MTQQKFYEILRFLHTRILDLGYAVGCGLTGAIITYLSDAHANMAMMQAFALFGHLRAPLVEGLGRVRLPN